MTTTLQTKADASYIIKKIILRALDGATATIEAVQMARQEIEMWVRRIAQRIRDRDFNDVQGKRALLLLHRIFYATQNSVLILIRRYENGMPIDPCCLEPIDPHELTTDLHHN